MANYKAADMFNLNGQAGIITGASKGIGMNIAKCLAENGIKTLGLCARNLPSLEKIARDIRSEYGTEVIALQADVTNKAQVKNFVKQVYDASGRIDILVNNAGISGSTLISEAKANPEKIKDFDFILENAISVMQTNLKALTIITEEVTNHMKQRNYGRIVNIASAVGLFNHLDMRNEAFKVVAGTNKDFPEKLIVSLSFQSYRVSKTAQIIQTWQDAKRYGQYGITVNAIAPAYIEIGKDLVGDKDLIEHWKDIQVIKSNLEVDSIMPQLLSLVSPIARHTTGAIVQIDGGWQLERIIRELLVKDPQEYIDRMIKAYKTVLSKWNPLRSVLKY